MTTVAPIPFQAKRLVSLDALRGLTIAFMIMVNNNASDRAWPFMKHADWNGLTATDLVFPTFLFLVGASIVFAFEARLARGATRTHLAWQTVRRAAVLFLFGLIVNGFGMVLATFPHVPWGSWRVYGVLQRIAICYLIAGLFYLWDRRWQTKLALLVIALVGYYILLRWVPIPGAGMPGRDFEFLDKRQNMTGFVDRAIFPPQRLYLKFRDPEGLLSDLPSLGTSMLGMLAALWMRTMRTVRERAAGLAAAAAVCLLLGSIWALWFPPNKNLWTSTFVLLAAGVSLSFLALFFWMIEVKNWRGTWLFPLLVLGSNSIAAYMISELIGTVLDLIPLTYNGHRIGPLGWIYFNSLAKIPDGGMASFAYSFMYLVLCFIPVWIMYRRKIFLKV